MILLLPADNSRLETRMKSVVVQPFYEKQSANPLYRSIESSSYDQSAWNETVRNDLADVIARLAIMETEIKKVAKQAENKATEGQKIGRSLRRRQ